MGFYYFDILLPTLRLKVILSLSISDFHPDTWNPAWSVGTILTGLLSFMVEESSTYGSMEASSVVRRRLARNSATENLKNETFVELFPDLVKIIKETAVKERLERSLRDGENEASADQSQTQDQNENQNLIAQQTDNTIMSNLAVCAVILIFAFLAGLERFKFKLIILKAEMSFFLTYA